MLLTIYIPFIGLLVPSSSWCSPVPHASALPSLLRCCRCLLCLFILCRYLLVLQLFHCVSLSTVLGFCGLLYSVYFAMHAGIACLHYACWDSLSGFPGLWLVNWFCDCILGMACLASLACDLVTACWDSMSALCMLGQHVWLPQPVIGWLLMTVLTVS